MRKLIYFSVINSENKLLYDKIIKSTRVWNRGFSRGYTPDPRLRWKIDEITTDYHNKTSNDLKIATVDGLKNNLVQFLSKYSSSTSTINKKLIDHILYETENFLDNEEHIKLETNISEISKWLNNHVGENLFIYKTNYDGKENSKIIQKIKFLLDKDKLTKNDKIDLFDCYKHFDNIFDLKMTNFDQSILMKSVLEKRDISSDNNEEIWHTLYGLLRYSDDFENNRLIWDNNAAQNERLQELRETILDNDNDGRTVFSTVNGKKIVFLKNGNYISCNKLIKLFKQNPTSDFLDFFLSISYYYDGHFTLKEKKKIRQIIKNNNISLEITSPTILGYFSGIMHNDQ